MANVFDTNLFKCKAVYHRYDHNGKILYTITPNDDEEEFMSGGRRELLLTGEYGNNDSILLTRENFKYLLDTIKELKDDNLELKKRIKNLEEAIEFHPDMEEAKDAKNHFESLVQMVKN